MRLVAASNNTHTGVESQNKTVGIKLGDGERWRGVVVIIWEGEEKDQVHSCDGC